LVAKFSPQRAKSKHTTTSARDKFLPADIVQIINDPLFWSTLFELQNLLLPLCGFLNKLQKDVARLHEVLHIFAFTMKLFRELSDLEFSTKMIERLEKRWAQWEQPLLLLSFILHPHYGIETFHSTAKRVTYTDFGQWINYYYEVWFNDRPKSILLEFVKFKKGKYPFDPPTVQQFGQDIMSFWESCSGYTPELSRLALHLYSVCVNAASVERLWSTMGFFHTKRRNRLEVSESYGI
jgi:hAT family C-terminal dimerisation region